MEIPFYSERYKSFDIIYKSYIDTYIIRGPYLVGVLVRENYPEFPTYREAVEYIDELREGRYKHEKR